MIGDGGSPALNMQFALHSESLQDPGVVAALVLSSKCTPHLKLLQISLQRAASVPGEVHTAFEAAGRSEASSMNPGVLDESLLRAGRPRRRI